MEARRNQPTAIKTSKSSGANKQGLTKQPSEISLTPSQAAEKSKNEGRKHPLDALSKACIKQQPEFERRSGLQDVDDEYIKQYVYRKSLKSNPLLNEQANQMAGQQQVQQQKQQHQLAAGTPSNQTHMVQNPYQAQQLQNQQQQILQQRQYVPQQQMQYANPAAIAAHVPGQTMIGAGDGNKPMNNVAAAAAMQQNEQYQPQQQQATQQFYNNQPNMMQQTGYQPAATAMQQQQQHYMQQQQQQMPPQIIVNQSEPDMCATCPHCQTTIYLVRNNLPPGQEMQMQKPNNAAVMANDMSAANPITAATPTQ